MTMRSLFTGIFFATSLYILLTYPLGKVLTAPESMNNLDIHRTKAKPIEKFTRLLRYSGPKNEYLNDFFADDDEIFEITKRKNIPGDIRFLRLGKKGDESPSEDYGYFRYGRNDGDDQ